MEKRFWVFGHGLMVFFVAVGFAAAKETAMPDSLSEPSAASSQGAVLSSSGGAANPDSSGKPEQPMHISLNFQDANLRDVLKFFSQQTGLNIIASKDVQDQAISLYLEDVPVMDALDQILKATNLTVERPEGSSIYIIKPLDQQKTGLPALMTRIYRLRYARVSASALAASASSLSAGGGGGGGSGGDATDLEGSLKKLLTDRGFLTVDARTNSLMVTDVPENFPRVEAALAAFDVKTKQIMVDAEIVETTLNKAKDLGIDWGGGSSGTLATYALTTGTRSTRFPLANLTEHLQPTGATHFSPGSLNLSSFSGTLNALESDTETKILARPKILTLDNEKAIIKLTADEAVGFQVTTGESSGTSTATPERQATGVQLTVTPQVNADGYITMYLEPSVTKTVAAKITPPTNQGSIRDAKTRTAQIVVRVRNGETIVVGGLIDRQDDETNRRTPIFSGIPFFGEAFKRLSETKASSELLVFITPHILDEPVSEQLAATLNQGTAGLREQEGPHKTSDTMEQKMNDLEKQEPL